MEFGHGDGSEDCDVKEFLKLERLPMTTGAVATLRIRELEVVQGLC